METDTLYYSQPIGRCVCKRALRFYIKDILSRCKEVGKISSSRAPEGPLFQDGG